MTTVQPTTAQQTDAVRPRFLVANALFVYLGVGVAAWAAWPIYQSVQFVILVIASVLLATGIAYLGLWRRFSWLTLAIISLAVYLVVGVPLAVPSSLTGLSEILGGWVRLATGTVLSWKELATITTIPVGSFQTLLVPALVLFLFGTVAMLSIAWRSPRFFGFVVPVALVLQGFGLVFGAQAVSPAITIGAVEVAAPRELVIGFAAFFSSLAFLLWRVQHTRRVAVRAAQSLAGITQGREARGSQLRRFALFVAIIVVAVGAGVVVSPALGSASDRSVLRSVIDPDTTRQLAESPLSDYREYFTSGRYDADLFTVSGDRQPDERLRLAVLSYYDGQVFRAIDPETTDGSAASAFVRVPYKLDPGATGTSSTLGVAVGDYDGVWLPTTDHLEQITFTGSNAQKNSESFFYNATTASGVNFGSLEAGETYELQAVTPASVRTLADIEKPSSASGLAAKSVIPESLTKWVDDQQVTPDGAGLATLIDRLRARGYLSHSLIEPAQDAANPNWRTDLATVGFESSRAGHSVDRISALFTQLIDKANELPESERQNDAALVSAVGDDEQFAVAAALLAQSEGFPSRVVLGFSLDATSAAPDELPACEESCKGKNLTAWIEVQDADGSWVSVDTSPQYSSPITPVELQRQDPKITTEVLPDAATAEDAPAAEPSGGETSDQEPQEEPVDLTWLVTLLKTVGLSLLGVLVLLAPFATILFAKARRRKERRKAVDPELQIVGGWDEYIDVALDHGYPVPTTETRSQVAAEYRTPRGLALATLADRAVFGPVDPGMDDGEKFWDILESERLAFARGMTRWQRLRAALSLRSFGQYLRARSTDGPTGRVTKS
jgi:hypothetical protein